MIGWSCSRLCTLETCDASMFSKRKNWKASSRRYLWFSTKKMSLSSGKVTRVSICTCWLKERSKPAKMQSCSRKIRTVYIGGLSTVNAVEDQNLHRTYLMPILKESTIIHPKNEEYSSVLFPLSLSAAKKRFPPRCPERQICRWSALKQKPTSLLSSSCKLQATTEK